MASTTNTDPYEGKIWTYSGSYCFKGVNPSFGYYTDYMGHKNLAFTPFGTDAADLNHELGDYVTLRLSTTNYEYLLDIFDDIAKEYYSKQGRDIDVISLNGSIELAPILNLSDVIVDIVETGSTLKENNLEVVEKFLPISARLIANKSSFKFKTKTIEDIVTKISELI